jgi:translation initiation factor 1
LFDPRLHARAGGAANVSQVTAEYKIETQTLVAPVGSQRAAHGVIVSECLPPLPGTGIWHPDPLTYNRGMSDRDRGRLVYSTDRGRICPNCGWPEQDCKCSSQRAPSEAIPKRIVAKLRMEKTGRGGKTVTVVDGLPNNAAFLKDLCSELKRACGTGGAVADGAVELQGDLRDRIRDVLTKKGFAVKG